MANKQLQDLRIRVQELQLKRKKALQALKDEAEIQSLRAEVKTLEELEGYEPDDAIECLDN